MPPTAGQSLTTPGLLDRLAAKAAAIQGDTGTAMPSDQLPPGATLDPSPMVSRLPSDAVPVGTNQAGQATTATSDPYAQFDPRSSASASPQGQTPGLLDRLADARRKAGLNPFDVYDSPGQQQPKNPFDVYDSPPASLSAGATLVNRGQPSATGSATLPAGATLDPTSPPGLLDRLKAAANQAGGIAGRGILGGVGDVISLGQAAGRVGTYLDGKLGISDPQAFRTATNADVRGAIEREEDRQGFYRPTGAVGQGAEAAIEAATGGALTGGTSTGLLGLNAAAGAAGSLAQSAGATPGEAALLTLGIGAGGAARGLAGDAAAASVVRRTAPAVTSDPDAAASVLRASQMLQEATAATPKASPASAAATVSSNLQRGLTAHVAMLKRTGLIDADDASSLKSAISDAADPSHTGAGLQATVDGLNLPLPLSTPLSQGLQDLNTVSSGILSTSAAGPLRSLGRLAGIYSAPVVSAVGSNSVGLGPLLDLAAGAAGVAAHRPAAAVGGAVGSLGDLIAGTRVSPADALTAAATKTLGGASPGALPTDQLAAVQTAYRDAQASAASDAASAAAATTKAKQVDQAYKQNSAATNAAEDAWTKAEAQKAKQDAAGAPDPLSATLWKAAQPDTSPNLSAVTTSQSRGFQADQSAIIQQAQARAQAQAAMEARGRNLADQAGNWIERQQIAAFKQANPDVPVTGAAALQAQGPAQVFDATGGRYGSPAGEVAEMTGIRSGPASATLQVQPTATPNATPSPAPSQGLSGAPPAASSGSPVVSMPSGPTGAPASLQAAPGGMSRAPFGPFPAGANPTGLIQPETGGKALATMMHRQNFGGPAPTPDELSSAIDDVAADGLVHPHEADAAHAGQNVSPAFALTIAHRVQAARMAAPISATAADQATAEVGNLLANPPGVSMPAGYSANSAIIARPSTGPTGSLAAPFGVDGQGTPIRNPIAYRGAQTAYQRHAATMIALAQSPAEKQALSQIATEPRSVDKAAIRDVYQAANPNADLSRFTSALMAGTA